MNSAFTGKIALVTGGGSGIGRATALAFAAQGASVVLADRSEPGGMETVELIRSTGGNALFIKADVSKSDEVQAMIAELIGHYGGLDFAFNNAGIEGDPKTSITSYSEAVWDDVMDINLKGIFLSMKFELPHIARTRGAIVNMASVAGLTGRMGIAYCASKHGVIGLTKAAALEFAEQGVRINAVAPAIIQTPMLERAFLRNPALPEHINKMHPLGRIGLPEEVASAVLWLCSPGASFTTGHTLPIDGGMLIP